MEKGSCVGVADSSKFASPVPAIGVYIASSTLACLFLMACDILQGYRHKKVWFPCKFFSLNSLTLTLLGIATKIPVDLTTSMPSGLDQVSKLCGTLMISISMAFSSPSLADMDGYELVGNVASITILVVTATVNICMQMSTGVIFSSFYIEHVITITFMWLILVTIWYQVFINTSINRDITFVKGEVGGEIDTRGLQEQLTVSLKYNPQLMMCKSTPIATSVGILCILSVVVTLEVCIRILFINRVKFCEGESDYKWSMWVIVVAQVLTVVVGTLAITKRWLLFVIRHDESSIEHRSTYDVQRFKFVARVVLAESYSPWNFTKMGIVKIFEVVEEVVIYFLFATQIVMAWTQMFLIWSLRFASSKNGNLTEYLEQKATENVESWMKRCRKGHPHHVIDITSKTPPSSSSSHNLFDGKTPCLLLVLLVQIVNKLLPPSVRTESLSQALDEVFEILYFIDEQQSTGLANKLKRSVAKDLWKRRDLHNNWFQKKFINPVLKKYPLDDVSSSTASYRVTEFTRLLFRDLDFLELEDENHFLGYYLIGSTSREDVINQAFVDILYQLLPQLPKLISKFQIGPFAKWEKRAMIALKLMCTFESMKPHIKWLSTEDKVEDNEITQVVDALRATSHVGESIEAGHIGEILQVVVNET